MKKLKNSVLLLLILSLTITAMVSLTPVYASPTAISVEPPAVVGPEYEIGTSFTVDVYVTDVVNLFGFEFKLKYIATILDATEITLGPLFPDVIGPPPDGPTIIWHEEINDDLGYVFYAVSLGQDQTPISASGPLATISFTVDALGGTILDLYDTKLSDPSATPILHEVYDGLFTNVKNPPVAIFTASPDIAEVKEKIDFDASASYDPDYPEEGGTIVRYDWDFGDGTTETKFEPMTDYDYELLGTYTVTLTITDDMGAQGSAELTVTVVPPSAVKADLAEWSAKPAHKNHDKSRYGTINTLYALVQNLGDASVTVKVKFTIYSGRGAVGYLGEFETNEYPFEAGTYLDTTDTGIPIWETWHGLNTTDVGEFDTTKWGTGRFYVTAQCFWDDGTGYVPGTKIKVFSFVVKE